MNNIIKRFFGLFGVQVVRNRAYSEITMDGALKRAKARNVSPATVIDVGAARGTWSLAAKDIWEKADFVLIEPLEERRDELAKLASSLETFHAVHKGAGSREEEIDFFVTEDLDGSGISDNGTNARKVKIVTTTVDKEISRLGLRPPYLLKLDTHGYEAEILEGAADTLKKTVLVIVECYGHRIAKESLLFWEMCRLMQQKGFRLNDIVDVKLRPADSTFWQCDAFFAPEHAKCFNHSTYNYT